MGALSVSVTYLSSPQFFELKSREAFPSNAFRPNAGPAGTGNEGVVLDVPFTRTLGGIILKPQALRYRSASESSADAGLVADLRREIMLDCLPSSLSRLSGTGTGLRTRPVQYPRSSSSTEESVDVSTPGVLSSALADSAETLPIREELDGIEGRSKWYSSTNSEMVRNKAFHFSPIPDVKFLFLFHSTYLLLCRCLDEIRR